MSMGQIQSTPDLTEKVLVHFTVRYVIKIRHVADQLRIASDEVKDSGVLKKHIHEMFPIVFVTCYHSTSQARSL